MTSTFKSYSCDLFDFQERWYQCDLCGNQYAHNKDLKKHKTAKHNIGEKPQCELCGKTLQYRANMHRHMEVFHSESPLTYTCIVHGKSYRDKSHLSRHLRSHKPDESNEWECIRVELANREEEEEGERDELKT